MSLRWLTGRSHTGLVLGGNSEVILQAFFETDGLVGHIRRRLDDAVPSRLELLLPLQDVVSDL